MSLFSMDAGQSRVRLVHTGAGFLVAALLAGCGSAYRPVVTPINPSGPAAQPNSLAAVISSPAPGSPGIVTILDYSGDTIMATAPIGPSPIAFSVDANGSTGYTLNSDHTLTNFPVSTSLQEKFVSFSTLPGTAQPVGLFSPSAGLWAADLDQNVADVLTGSPETFRLAIPVAPTPIAVIGTGTIAQHNYAISQNNSSTGAIPFGVTCNNAPSSAPQNGEADALEVSSFTVSARIPLGKCPVYAVPSSDGRRVFVLNRGSDTVTVINSQDNTLDACTPFLNQSGQLVTCHPSLPLSTTAGLTGANVPSVAGPVYAEYNAATQQLIVADYDGGTVSVIDVSLDIYGNDSQTFGTTFTIPVGNNPASVTALADGSRAYTADQADGTVHILNLSSHTVEKKLAVVGHPRTVVSTSNSLFGKVYVASPDSPYLTIIRTDQDIVDTTVLVQGNVMDVRVASQDANRGNNNNVSRVPGGGQPCYMPGAANSATLALCQTLP
jgi:DNA-binding beta-propeller fold protein YncE